jgi:hypothetical protein
MKHKEEEEYDDDDDDDDDDVNDTDYSCFLAYDIPLLSLSDNSNVTYCHV